MKNKNNGMRGVVVLILSLIFSFICSIYLGITTEVVGIGLFIYSIWLFIMIIILCVAHPLVTFIVGIIVYIAPIIDYISCSNIEERLFTQPDLIMYIIVPIVTIIFVIIAETSKKIFLKSLISIIAIFSLFTNISKNYIQENINNHSEPDNEIIIEEEPEKELEIIEESEEDNEEIIIENEPDNEIIIEEEPEKELEIIEESEEIIIEEKPEIIQNSYEKGEYYVYPSGNTVVFDAGILNSVVGTITFYDPLTNKYGSMGHPVTDYPIKINKTDSVAEFYVTDLERAIGWDAQNVNGDINSEIRYGDVYKNGTYGVYGNYNNNSGYIDELYKVGWKNEVHTGPALIISEVPNENDTQVYFYNIEITEINENNFNFIIIDEYMISNNKGVAHGMSGTPVIQDNKIIGALSGFYYNYYDTELNKTRFDGYGVYIEDMLIESGIIEK